MANNNKVDVGFIFQITDKVLWNVFKKNEIGDGMENHRGKCGRIFST